MKFKPYLTPISWSFYDFANTIYSMNVVSFYFPLWIIQEKGMPEIVYSLVYGGAIVLASFFSPVLGYIADLRKSLKGNLIGATFIAVFFTALISWVTSPVVGLICFFAAHFGYVLSLVFYNSMLPAVSQGSTPGKICGLGVGLGYVGTIFGLWVAGLFDESGRQAVFLPTAIMFLVFSIPLFLFAPTKVDVTLSGTRERPKLFSFKVFKIWQLKQHSKEIRYFFLANFLCGDAVHTVILYMAVYAKMVFEMTDDQIRHFLIISTLVAIAASFVWGEFTSRKGSYWTLKIVLCLWLFIFITGSLISQLWLVWIIGGLVGMALAGTWVSTRVLVLDLVPKDRIGEYFGFYNLTGKSAAILGPLWWGGLLLLLSSLGALKYRITLFSLSLFIIAALWALNKVKIASTPLCGSSQ